MLKLIDRYLLKEIIPPFFVGLLVYTFVLLMNQILLLSELFITKGVSLKVTLETLIFLIPSILAFAIPMSVLMGILGGLSRMSSDSEVVAFKTLGISFRRILKPVLLFSLGGWIITSYLALFLAPRANHKWIQTLTESVLMKVQVKIDPREFNETIPATTIFIQDIDRENGWENIFVHLSDIPDKPRIILAKRGRLNVFPELKRATLELFDGTLHSCPLANPENYSVTSFMHLQEEINIQAFFASSAASEKRVKEKDIKELWKDAGTLRGDLDRLGKESRGLSAQSPERDGKNLAWSMEKKTRDHRSTWVEIHKKFALPFVCLIFAFLGLPLGASTKKGGRTSGFTLSLGIILIYYILITAGEKLAMDGKITPFLGMWGPNILLGLAAAFSYLRASRESPLLAGFSRFFSKRRERPERPSPRRFTRRLPRLSPPFPNILDRYVIRKYLFIFLLVFLSLVSISVIVTFFERIDNIYRHNKPFYLLLDYIRYRIPEFVHFILPVAALTTALLVLGLLTKTNEITAMKACGISVYRLIVPVILLGGLVSLFSFYLQERILPYSNKKAEEIWNKINDVPPRSYSYINRRWVVSQKKDRIYHYSYFDPQVNAFTMLNIFELDQDSWTLKNRIFSETGYLRGESLFLVNSWLRNFDEGRPVHFERRDRLTLPLEEGKEYFLKEWKEPDQMNYAELKQYTGEIEAMGFDTVRFKVDLSYKLSFPFVSLIMTLLGIPFAFSMGKRGALVGIGLSIVIAMIYWGIIGVFKSLGYVGFLNAFLAAWGPNMVFGLAGIYLLFTLRT